MERMKWEEKYKQKGKRYKKYDRGYKETHRKKLKSKRRCTTVEEDPTWKSYERVLDKLNQQLKKIDSLLRQAVHNE